MDIFMLFTVKCQQLTCVMNVKQKLHGRTSLSRIELQHGQEVRHTIIAGSSQKFYILGEHSPVPEIRVYASIYMLPNNTVEVGGRAVVRCRVTGNHHNRVEVSVKYNNSIYDVEMVKRGLEYTDYHLVVDDLYKEGYREYTCIGELYEHCIREANVTYLNVISSNGRLAYRKLVYLLLHLFSQ